MSKTGQVAHVDVKRNRPGQRRIIAAAVAAAFPLAAWSQAQPQQLERVEITGSSIKRIDAETALPVQVITREQIAKTGATNVEQLLQTISAVSSSGGLTSSSASGATTGGLSAISLHGLTSLRTLVLLNGRRIAPYGIGFTGDSVSVDVSAIPLAAIERVEVLKDGASAIYGSDAIAGVVNFILRQEFNGIEVTGEYGDTTQGGASFKRASGVFGFGNLASDRFNVMLVASYQKEGALFGRDRSFAKSGINDINDTSSGNTFPANIAAADGSFGSHNPSAATGCLAPYSTLDPNFPNTVCRFDPAPLVSLLPASERASVFASAKFAITPDIQAYGEAAFNRNTIRTVIQPVPISDQFALPATNPLFNVAPYNGVSTILLTTASPYYPTAYVQSITGGATPDLLVRYRAAGAGNRDFTDIAEAPRFVAGVKGTAAGWDFDSALLYSESKVREHDNGGYPALTKILPILNSGNVNFFGPNTPDVDAALLATNFTGDAFNHKSSLTRLTARGSRDLVNLPAGPLGLAIGAEGRKEKYDFVASPEIATGDIAGYGGNLLDVNRSRNVTAFFSEVNVPVVKNLEANFAVRYDHYAGVGSSTTPKASLRWQPTPQMLFRTSFGNGFRAPSLQDLYGPNLTGVTPQGATDILRCPTTHDGVKDCATQFTVTTGGNAGLKPEKSHNFTLGTVLEPINNVSVGIDYFRVRLQDTIVNGIGAAVILADPIKYASLITRGPVDPAFPNLPGPITNINLTNINLGITKVAGFDFDVKWRLPAGDWGRFTVNGSATYFNQFDTSNLDGSFSGGVDLTNPATGGIVPRFKSYLAVDWTRGPWNLVLAQNFQKGYNDLAGTNEVVPRRVSSYTTYDLQASYSAFKSWRFTLGVRNLFDRDPPYSNAGGQTSFQSGYDNQYGDPRGRFVYGRVTYSYQ
ncbi:MAG: TonB-dependent receptor plug domain-containing protein [Caldimonas sp.]